MDGFFVTTKENPAEAGQQYQRVTGLVTPRFRLRMFPGRISCDF